MKFLFSPLAMLRSDRSQQHNVRILSRFVALLLVLTVAYMAVFRLLMHLEGQETSWITAFYWVFTVMSTLGFGDITFSTDLGRLFSMVVLASGMVFLLVLLPFLFIELFYIPWSERQKAARTPFKMPESLSNHVLLTHVDATALPLRKRLDQHSIPHVLIRPTVAEALTAHDDGWNVMVGDLDLPSTFRCAGIDRAALVAATGSDAETAHVAFTVREIEQQVPIVGLANHEDSIDVLELAGCTEVIHLADRLGDALARRVCSAHSICHVIGSFDDLLIAEATASQSPWVGLSLKEAEIRRRTGVSVVGIWERGSYKLPTPETLLGERTILLLAGTRSQLDLYNSRLSDYSADGDAPLLIVGGGRVGRAASRALERVGTPWRIVEIAPDRIPAGDDRYFLGSGADRELIERAGLLKTPSVLVTTHDDDLNVFLVLYYRKLRPDLQILSRASRDRNVETLHRAGADFVLSYASMGATAIFDHLDRTETLAIADGLILFRVKAPSSLIGRSLADARVRPKTGATVVAVEVDDQRSVNPDPKLPLEPGSQLILIGSDESETNFLETFQDA
ncbi:MAG: NAD-binding protein [Acidobacteriota bacterium]